MIYEEQTLTNKANDELAQERTVLEEHGQVIKVVYHCANRMPYRVDFLRFCTNYDTRFSNYRIELVVALSLTNGTKTTESCQLNCKALAFFKTVNGACLDFFYNYTTATVYNFICLQAFPSTLNPLARGHFYKKAYWIVACCFGRILRRYG